MEKRHVAITSRPFANSKARRAEKDVPDWKLSPKKNINREACNNPRISSQPPQPQQLRQSARGSAPSSCRRSRLRSPSLPSISEAHHRNYCHHNSDDGHPKSACPTAPSPSTISNNKNTNDAVTLQGLRDSNEALLDLVTELIQLIPTPFPVHDLIRRREEARSLADRAAPITTAVVERQSGYHNNTTPLLREAEVNEKDVRKTKFVKGRHPRSKSSVF
ncbi:uncharacterized protein PG998_012710 [Apiospora kogelbergensis]|uniref:Uncharacterized protein n=1 Tax=Apiospora kogelbergensis TaxID=1337665 RepID=A0AAW0Q4S3_9PEZI